MRIYSRVVLPLVISVISFDVMATSKTVIDEMTCGQEMAADSEVPDQLARLMSHVATNMETHARWAGGSVGGKQEHDGLMVVAREYEAIAAAARRAAKAMKDMENIPPIDHDPSLLDRAGQVRWMRSKIEMQLQFAQMLTRHADVSKKVLTQMEQKGPPSNR